MSAPWPNHVDEGNELYELAPASHSWTVPADGWSPSRPRPHADGSIATNGTVEAPPTPSTVGTATDGTSSPDRGHRPGRIVTEHIEHAKDEDEDGYVSSRSMIYAPQASAPVNTQSPGVGRWMIWIPFVVLASIGVPLALGLSFGIGRKQRD